MCLCSYAIVLFAFVCVFVMVKLLYLRVLMMYHYEMCKFDRKSEIQLIELDQLLKVVESGPAAVQ